jgi:predicted RNA methylase
MSSSAGASAAQQTLIAALQKTPFESADAVLTAQLKAVDDWEATVRDHPALVATAQVARAQVQAQQRMLDVLRRESEVIAEAIRQAARAMGVPTESANG